MRSGIGRAFDLSERGAPTRQDPLGTESTRLEKIRLYNNACLLEERMDEFFAAWDREGEAISLEHGSDRALSLLTARSPPSGEGRRVGVLSCVTPSP